MHAGNIGFGRRVKLLEHRELEEVSVNTFQENPELNLFWVCLYNRGKVLGQRSIKKNPRGAALSARVLI